MKIKERTNISAYIKTAPEGFTFMDFKRSRPRRVLYLNLELSEKNMHRRFKRMCEAMGVQPAQLGNRIKIVNLRGITVKPRHLLALARQHRPEVMIIDPLYKILEGDENLAKDMKPILAAFDAITMETGTAIIYVHHNPKGRAGDRDARDRGAGSGVLARDYDAAIYLNDHFKGDDFVVMSTIARNFPKSDPVSIEFTEGCFVLSDEAPIELTSSNAKASKAHTEIEPADVMERVKFKGPLTAAQLVKMIRDMGCGKDAAVDLKKRMVSAGQIECWQEPVVAGVTWHGTKEQIKTAQKQASEAGQRKLEV